MGWKKMSRGSSVGQTSITICNEEIAVEFVYSGQGEMKNFLSFKHYNCKLWLGGTVIVTFSDAVVTLNVLTASNNEAEKLVETRTVHFAWL